MTERSRRYENAKQQSEIESIAFIEIERNGGTCNSLRVPDELLIVLLRAPRPGQVKTRIAKTAGPERACAICRRLVERVLQNIESLGAVQLRFAPDDARAEIQPWLRRNWSALPQGTGDLGERLHRTFEESFSEGALRVVILGSDCPEASASDVRTAFAELKSYDVVIGPAVDGGYWLIGLRAPQIELFREISWSSDQVLAQTLAKAKALGLKSQLLRILSDIDTEKDWNAYVREDGAP